MSVGICVCVSPACSSQISRVCVLNLSTPTTRLTRYMRDYPTSELQYWRAEWRISGGPLEDFLLVFTKLSWSRGGLVYQASFNHEKVSAMPFFLTKKIIIFVFNMLAIFLKTFPERCCPYTFIENSWGSLDQIVTTALRPLHPKYYTPYQRWLQQILGISHPD